MAILITSWCSTLVKYVPLLAMMGTPPCANVWNIFVTRCDGRSGALEAGIETDEVLAGTVGRFGRLRGLLFVRLEAFCREQTVARFSDLLEEQSTYVLSTIAHLSPAIQSFARTIFNREKIVPQCRTDASSNLLRRNASTVSSILDS